MNTSKVVKETFKKLEGLERSIEKVIISLESNKSNSLFLIEKIDKLKKIIEDANKQYLVYVPSKKYLNGLPSNQRVALVMRGFRKGIYGRSSAPTTMNSWFKII